MLVRLLTACCRCIHYVGEGQWTFADGLSYFRGTYKAGKRVEGRLVLFDAATGKPAHTYTGR